MTTTTTTITGKTSTEVPTTASTRSSLTRACPKCGTELAPAETELAQDARTRIEELESQVKILTGKATAAVDKLADYEDELRQLKSTHHASDDRGLDSPSDTALVSATNPLAHPEEISRPATATGTAIRTSILPVQNRLSSFLSSSTRRSSPTPTPPPLPLPPPAPSTPTSSDLQAALTREQALREHIQAQLAQTEGELEDLSASVFQEANEMVAAERRAKVKLEQRVEVLERRDVEKRKRLERLEAALQRIERVRGLLGK